MMSTVCPPPPALDAYPHLGSQPPMADAIGYGDPSAMAARHAEDAAAAANYHAAFVFGELAEPLYGCQPASATTWQQQQQTLPGAHAFEERRHVEPTVECSLCLEQTPPNVSRCVACHGRGLVQCPDCNQPVAWCLTSAHECVPENDGDHQPLYPDDGIDQRDRDGALSLAVASMRLALPEDVDSEPEDVDSALDDASSLVDDDDDDDDSSSSVVIIDDDDDDDSDSGDETDAGDDGAWNGASRKRTTSARKPLPKRRGAARESPVGVGFKVPRVVPAVVPDANGVVPINEQQNLHPAVRPLPLHEVRGAFVDLHHTKRVYPSRMPEPLKQSTAPACLFGLTPQSAEVDETGRRMYPDPPVGYAASQLYIQVPGFDYTIAVQRHGTDMGENLYNHSSGDRKAFTAAIRDAFNKRVEAIRREWMKHYALDYPPSDHQICADAVVAFRWAVDHYGYPTKMGRVPGRRVTDQ